MVEKNEYKCITYRLCCGGPRFLECDRDCLWLLLSARQETWLPSLFRNGPWECAATKRSKASYKVFNRIKLGYLFKCPRIREINNFFFHFTIKRKKNERKTKFFESVFFFHRPQKTLYTLLQVLFGFIFNKKS